MVGILAIVFSCIGIVWSAASATGSTWDIRMARMEEEASSMISWLAIGLALSTVVFVVHLVGGILTVMRRRAGSILMTVYGVLAILLVVTNATVWIVLDPGQPVDPASFGLDLRRDVVYEHLAFNLLALPWPVIALLLVNDRALRRP